jgi:hypothetical protein
MAYLPASRAVDTVGMDPMFYGRVSGIGMDLTSKTQYTPAEIATQKARAKYAADMALWEKTYGEAYSKVIDGCPRCITYPCPCPAANEFLRLNPEPVMEEIAVPKTVASKPTASTLPLLIGAAFLLLS